MPEYRTDKNGRNVLRHVRSEQASSSSAALVSAAPTVVIPDEVPKFNEGFQSFWDQQDISDTGYSESDFDPRAVEVFNRVFDKDSQHEPYPLMRALATGLNEMLGAGEEDEGRMSVHNIAAFADDLHQLAGLRSYIDGLHLTLGYTKDYLTDADDKERETAAAIIKLTEALGENSSNFHEYIETKPAKYVHSFSLKDEGMLKLAIEFAPRIDEVLSFIEEDKPAPSPEHLQEMLLHEQPALARGVL